MGSFYDGRTSVDVYGAAAATLQCIWQRHARRASYARGSYAQAWLCTKGDITVSMFQWSVLATARFAGFDVQPEYDDGFFSVDMAVFLPGTPPVKVRAAVAVLGPEFSHRKMLTCPP